MTDQQPPPPTPAAPVPDQNQPPVGPHHRRRGPGVWRVFFGLIFILIGVQILAQQYGWAWHWSIDFSRIWPLFIILIGLSFLFRPHGRAGWLMPAIVAVLVLVVVALPVVGPTPANQRYERTVSIDQAAAATRANIRLNVGATELTVAGGSTQLVSGHFSSSFADLQSESTVAETQQIVIIKNDPWHGQFWFGDHRQTLDLRLADAIATTLSVEAGASQATVDLTGTHVDDLNINAGAGQLGLTLSDEVTETTVDINAGASSMTVDIPSDIGVRLTVDAGLSSKTLPKFTALDGRKNQYESDNYATATKHATISIDAGASSITVHWQ